MSLLAGIRVLDVASYVAGPAAATVMADFGADVIKVEPRDGDPLRLLGANPGPHNPVWVNDSRSKRSLCLDLKHPEGHALLLQLVARSDVFVTNFRAPVLERLKLRYEDIRPLNARLIYASVTGYGHTGPDADTSAFDVTAYWARSGLMDFVRRGGGLPAGSAPAMGDHATSMSLFAAVMAALYQRERTGTGTRVSTSLLANGLWANSWMATVALCGMPIASRNQPMPPGNAVSHAYQTRDGRWLFVNMMNEAKEWEGLLEVLDLQHLGQDPRFAELPERRRHAPALVEILAARFAELDRDDVQRRLSARQVTHGFALTAPELPHDAQLHATGILTPVEEPRDGLTHQVSSPLWMDGVAKRAPRYAPAIGEHSREVLRELGLDEHRIDALAAAGIIASPASAAPTGS